MALSDVNATPEQLEQLAYEQKRLKSELKRKREWELERANGPFTFEDAVGTQWGYSVIDGSSARIDSCSTTAIRLEIPEVIDDLPVLVIGAGACAKLETTEEIICPPRTASIGPGAFQICPNLRRVELPACVDEFDPSWLQRCGKLEALLLPGRLEVIPRSIFDSGHLKKLFVGASAHSVEPGAFERSQLDFLEIDPANPHIASDGVGLYTTDDARLVAICRQVPSYEIADGCSSVAAKAAYGLRTLARVTFPASVREIGELAFAYAEVESFVAPAGLQSIGAKAFYQCAHLEKVELNEGLLAIGDSAFEGSAIGALEVPGSVEAIGRSIARATNVVFAGAEATFRLASGSGAYAVDPSGGLYRHNEAGLSLEELLDENAADYQVADGTVAVAARALVRHPRIEHVRLPEGMAVVGESAFSGCKHLKCVELPDTLVEIGPEAFAGTALESIRVPARLLRIGDLALSTAGSRKIGSVPTLRRIEVDEGNEIYELVDGLLCERTQQGRRIIAFDNNHALVRFPDDVVEVAGFALGNAHGIRELRLNAALAEIGVGGLAIWSAIERLQVNVQLPIEGRTEFDFTFPRTVESMQAASTALGGYGFVNVREIARLCDKSILSCHNYARPERDGSSAYDQAILMANRLEDPVLMSAGDRNLFAQTIALHLEIICVDISRHDDRRLLSKMADLGFLNQGNIDCIISAVARLEDAATTAHLLEMKRRRFQGDPFDFTI